ncbi:MAG: MBOAT family O-acyltransferase [Chloroflexota bacterium]
MSLVHILVFTFAAGLHQLAARRRGREWFLLTASVAALYWLQPATPIEHLDFWLPTASLALAVWVWGTTRPQSVLDWREPVFTLAVCAAAVVAVTVPRLLNVSRSLTPTRPPETVTALGVLMAIAAVLALVLWLRSRRALLLASAAGLIAAFVLLKTQPLATQTSALLRSWTGQSPALASALDLRWLGFSYLAFRLLHTLRDRMLGRLPELTLRQFLIYALFFPALTAGPIDRVERFASDLRSPVDGSTATAAQAGWRLLSGIFKKYALADSLGLFALSATTAVQTSSALWSWLLLYAFAFQLYLDFSGYTDVAIGLGLLLGIRLPENFQRPYLQPNLTAFWNSWHITLANWFRAYFFNPVARALRQSPTTLPTWLVILASQVSTMVLIGLWHGVTWNFILWGAWHGLGLFIHNRWTALMRARRWDQGLGSGWPSRLAVAAGTLATFHYVTLGWVWFALPDPRLSASVLMRLFGL